MPPPLVSASVSSARHCSATTARRCGAKLSRQGRRRGDSPVMDFCFFLLVASCRRPLQRRWERGRRSAGASAAGLLGLARIWRMLASVLVLWFVVGGSGSASRRRRRERPDLVVVVLLGARPRPARHSDRWVPCVLLLGVFKAFRRWSCFGLGFAGGCSSSSRRLGVGEDGCFRAGGAESSEDFGVISISFGVLSVICTACRILLDRSVVSVCTYSVLRMLLA